MGIVRFQDTSGKYKAISTVKTTDANNTTESIDIFRVTGSIFVHALYMEITTTFGTNHTAGHFRLDDGTATVDITDASPGTTLSDSTAGSWVGKTGSPTAAMTELDAAAGAVGDDGSHSFTGELFTPFVITKKASADTDVTYRYTTTETPTSGGFRVYMIWSPMSNDGSVTLL